ncbi:MAG: glutathione peroxidase [Crocinitomicaceae bacterium]|jgi:glutathione peroxidase|nr:glutathione peroxidase [Crocinitomicaceae bacterium]
MRILPFISAIFLFTFCGNGQNRQANKLSNNAPMKLSIHSFRVQTLSGDTLDFSTFKGKKILVVNTASKCGLTPQYKELEALYREYQDSNFVIVGFPANNFMAQEPGSDDEIAAFCSKNYGVTFPMMSKISVKGRDMHPVYEFLTSLSKNGLEDNEVKWNFQKYLIDENGFLVRVISPTTPPNDPEIISWIKSK